jgi:hypothetical protein
MPLAYAALIKFLASVHRPVADAAGLVAAAIAALIFGRYSHVSSGIKALGES